MGSGKGSQSTSTVQIPQDVLNRYNSVNQTAQQAASKPFTPYNGEFVAPINSTEQAGINATNAASQSAQPYFNQAQGYITSGAQAVNPTDLDSASINKYMSPYLNNVLGSESALLNQNNQQQQSGQLGTAIQSGAFGGDRGGIAAANLAQQQSLANANIYSNILNTGYNNALGAAQQQQGVGLSAAQANRAAQQQTGASLAGLGTAAQTAGLQGAQAQIGAGQVAQNTQQGQDTALYNQFLQGQSYPFQVAQFLAGIAEGTGSLSGSTTSTNSTQNGIFSDRNLKTSVRAVGKTFDGQPIYTYKYKGHPQTHMGLMAQDVEDTHPDAVGLASGYKTVDYEKATDKAADRGHFAGGGSAEYDPGNWQNMLGAYQQMYAPLLNAKGGLGASSIVPQPQGGNHTLAVAQNPAPQKSPDILHEASSLASDVDSIGKEGDKLGAWKYSDKDPQTAFSEKGKINDDNDVLGDIYARGGMVRRGLAAGGDPDLPYEDNKPGLDIPTEQQKFTLNPAKPANAPGGGGLLDDAKDAAKIASTIMAFKRGGRIRRADGGEATPPNISAIRRALMLALNPMHQPQGEPAPPTDAANDSDMDQPHRMVANGPPAGLASAVAQQSEGPDQDSEGPSVARPGHLDPQVVSFLKSKGLGDDQAKGIAAGIYAESGNNPGAVNPTSGALGLGQWLGSRKKNLFDRYGENPDKGDQLDYLWHELNGGDRGGKSVLNQGDAPSALSAYIKNFMRPHEGAETAGDFVRGLGALRKGFADGGAPDPEDAASAFDIPALDASADDTGLASAKKPRDILPADFSDPVNDLDAKRGLASAAPVASEPAPANEDETKGNFWHNLKHGKADAILPILTGIGAFGTANTKNPLTALATGLGAGASEYQKMREFELEPQQLGINKMQAISSIYGQQNQAIANAQKIMSANYDYRPTNANTPWHNFITGKDETEAQHSAALRSTFANIAGRKIPGLDIPPLIPGNVGGDNGAPQGGEAQPDQDITQADIDRANAPEAAPEKAPPPPPSATTHAAVNSAGAPTYNPLPRGVSTTKRAAHGDYGIASLYQGAITPVDDSSVPTENRLSTLQANYQRLRDAGQVQAAQQVEQQIQAINSGQQMVLDANGNPFQGYKAAQDQRDMVEKQAAAMTAEKNKDVIAGGNYLKNDYPAVTQILDTMSQNLRTHNLNRGSPELANLIGQVRSIPGFGQIADAFAGYQGANDLQHKNALLQAFKNAEASGLTGAPASALREAIMTVADSGMDPGAKYHIITQAKGTAERMKDYYSDLINNQTGVTNYAKFQQDWNGEHRHSSQAYENRARAGTPYFAGMTTQQQQEAPMPGRAPNPAQWEQNHAVTTPDGQVRYWDAKTQRLYLKPQRP